MINKKTVLNERTIDSSGVIFIKFCKEIIEDGVVIASENHRCTIEPGMDTEQILNSVNLDIYENNKFPPIQENDKNKIMSTVSTEHTDDVIAFYNNKQKRMNSKQ